MNTPRTRAIMRQGMPLKRPRRTYPGPDGKYRSGIHNTPIALEVMNVIAALPHIDETMIDLMALLMEADSLTARQVFYSLTSENVRAKVMLSLLQKASINAKKGQEYDDFIALFLEIVSFRNDYAHGLWWTHESGDVYWSLNSDDDFVNLHRRKFGIEEAQRASALIETFYTKWKGIKYPRQYWPDGRPRT